MRAVCAFQVLQLGIYIGKG